MPHVQHDYFSSFNQSDHCFWPCLCRCRRAFTIWMEFPVKCFWTNGTALLLSKYMDRIEPYHLIPSFDISVRGPGAILHFVSEMLPQKAWRQVIDKWEEIFGNSGWIGKKLIPLKVLPFSPEKKFTGMNRTIWIHTGITGFSKQMVSVRRLCSSSPIYSDLCTWAYLHEHSSFASEFYLFRVRCMKMKSEFQL